VIAVFLKKIPNKRSGRTFLSIVEGYRDPNTGKVRHRTVQALGYLDELEKEHEDPIAHFTEVAKEMTKLDKELNTPIVFSFTPLDKIDDSAWLRKNLGFSVLSAIYHELEIHKFMANRQRSLKTEFLLNDVFKMLVFLRILEPGSKKKSFERKDAYFERFDFSLMDVYRSLTLLHKYKDALLVHLHEQVSMKYGRDMSNVFYDVTNYYFEIDEPDNLRKKGVSKEHRPNPIVQMGLLMDRGGIPVTYRLFSGNTNDCNTLLPILAELKESYNIDRMIVVADKGINTGENIAYSLIKGDGYIYSQSIRGAKKSFKNYVLNEKGYVEQENGFKIKSRVYPREIWVTNVEGERVKVPIDEKQVVFYSPDYAKKAKAERAFVIEKAKMLINNPGMYNQATSYGAAKYVKDLVFDKKTGEILTTGHHPMLDLEKILEEEKYDGYYAIVTSELNMPDYDVIDTYRGLWRIEESFRVTKSDLETRPVYVSREDHIQAHFLTCFTALLILRLLEVRTKRTYSPSTIINELRQVTGTYLTENYYMFDHFNPRVKVIGESVGIDFSKRFMSLGEVKKIIAGTKKGAVSQQLSE
jgi:transposase